RGSASTRRSSPSSASRCGRSTARGCAPVDRRGAVNRRSSPAHTPSVNIVDLLVIAGVGAAVVSGVRTGLVGMVAAAIGSIGGLLLGSALANDVADALGADGDAEVLVAAVVVVVAVTVLSYGAQLLAAPLSVSIDVLRLGWVDRLGGGVLAFVASLAIA